MKTPVNSVTLKQHLTYHWWMYALSAVLAVLLTALVYQVTRPVVPDDKKVEFFVYGTIYENMLPEYIDRVRETEMSDMEEMSSLALLDDGYYGQIQLTTYMATGEGDVYLLPRDLYISAASTGSLLPLEEDAELMAFFSDRGISLQNGWRKNTETGETHLYGIPQSLLPGLGNYVYVRDGYLCLIASGRNDVNAFRFLRILCRDMLSGQPVPVPSASPAP